MAKKKTRKKTKAKKRTESKAEMASDVLPTLPAMEGFLSSLGGPRRQRTPVEEAQQVMYDAWEAPPAQAIKLAKKALAISEDCADAYNFLAEHATSLKAARDLYEKGVAAGQRALGEQAFVEDVGHFWGLLETRPYMRARAGLAQCQWTFGERDEAVAHYRDMLRLNPGDNLGLRYVLMSCLLEQESWDEADELFKQYEDDGMAVWMYSRALLDFCRRGDSPTARDSLDRAMEANAHVPAFLTGKRRLPRRLPDHYGFGDESEAVLFVNDNGVAWQRTPSAIEWLKANT